MHRRQFTVLLALAAPLACTGAAPARLTLASPLTFYPVADPHGALARVAAAAEREPMSGLTVVEATLPPNEHAPGEREIYTTAPERGVFDVFMRAHPELEPPAGTHIFGYQRERDAESRPRWRMLCLQPDFAVPLGDPTDARIVEDPDTGRPKIRVQLGPEDTRSFADLTTRHLGRRIALVHEGVVAGEVLMAPIVMEPLRTGIFEISLGAAESRAEVEAAFKRMFEPRTG